MEMEAARTTVSRSSRQDMTLDSKTDAPTRCTVGHVQAHLIALGLLAVALAAVIGSHSAIWGRPAEAIPDVIFDSGAFFLAIGLAVIAHEALHAVGFRYFGGAPWKAIRVGVQWRTVTPFARALVPVSARAYRWTAALPGLALGALPMVAGVLLDVPFASGFGVLMLAGAGGDAAIVWAMRHTPDDALVLDCPHALGCLVVPGRPSPSQSG
jgi:hypothetical protein